MIYVVRSVRKSGTVTYHCRSTRIALMKLQDFEQAEYTNITVTTSDARVISAEQLRAFAAQETVVS